MGRPPSCSCHCRRQPIECDFTDNFSTTKSGYITSGTRTFALVGGPGGGLGAGTDAADGAYCQIVNVPGPGLRTITATAYCKQFAGLFIGDGRFCYVNPSFHGAPAIFIGAAGPQGQEGIAIATVTTVAGGAIPSTAVKLEIVLQETSEGVFNATYILDAIQIFSESAVEITLPSPANIGLTVFGSNGTTTPLWSPSFAIACQDTDGCPYFPAIAVVWAIPGIPGITGGASNFPCSNCAAYANSTQIYSTSLGALCRWDDGNEIQCVDTDHVNRFRPLWTLFISGTGASQIQLYAGLSATGGYNAFYELTSGTSFNPLGSNTFMFHDSPGGCLGWPATVTLSPA